MCMRTKFIEPSNMSSSGSAVLAPTMTLVALEIELAAVVVQRPTAYDDGGRERDVVGLRVEAIIVRHDHTGGRAVEDVGQLVALLNSPNYVRGGTVIAVARRIDHGPGGLVHSPVGGLRQQRGPCRRRSHHHE